MSGQIKIGGFNFEIFQLKSRSEKETVTINFEHGRVTLSTGSSKQLTKQHIEIGYDAEQRAIAIRPSEETGFSRKLSGKGSKHFMSKKFCEMIKDITKIAEKSKKYPCKWDKKEKMLIFKL